MILNKKVEEELYLNILEATEGVNKQTTVCHLVNGFFGLKQPLVGGDPKILQFQ